MPHSARATLRLPGRGPIAWATFDPDWYRRMYDDARDADREFCHASLSGPGTAPRPRAQPVVRHQRWYLRRYPDIAEAVRAGDWESGLTTTAGRDFVRSPHWLYDDDLYRERHPDLSDALLTASGFVNRFDHYLKHGNKEGRIAHPLFDPVF